MGHDNRARWVGNPPVTCDLCHDPIVAVFIDGVTTANSPGRGRWACMCVKCHGTHGVGLGTGKGQQYEKETACGDGGHDKPRWVKVRG